MRALPQAGPARLRPISPGRSWSSWIALTIRRRRGASQERLEVMERLASDQRHARRAGEYVSDLGPQSRRCP